MDRLDIINLLCSSFIIAYLTDISGIELIAAQTLWFGALWLGKYFIDRWLSRLYA